MDVDRRDPNISRVLALALMRQAEDYLISSGDDEVVVHLQRAIDALLKFRSAGLENGS
jgi:hypothetical protein